MPALNSALGLNNAQNQVRTLHYAYYIPIVMADRFVLFKQPGGFLLKTETK